MPRLFVALRPPPEIREPLCALMTGVSGARWQSDAQLHMTVRYIGEVGADAVRDVAEALGAVRVAPIAGQLAGVGTFDRRERVHTLWVGITPHDEICRLQGEVDRALETLGLELEPRVFVPHITVARLALAADAATEIAQWRERHAAFASTDFGFTHFALYDSHLAASGAEYREIACWPLRD
jgi:2'-5' RNA ligase